jgi:hypothetical protein
MALSKAKMETAFIARVRALLISLGATPLLSDQVAIETRAGTLEVSPYGDWVAMRFHDVGAARFMLGVGEHDLRGRLNPYSGKFNWQGTGLGQATPAERSEIEDQILASIEREIRPLLPAA